MPNKTLIRIKGLTVFQSLEQSGGLHRRMWELLIWLMERYGNKLVITSIYRPGDPGVHGQKPCRGLDIRSWVFHDPMSVVQAINDAWDYGDGKHNVALLHDAGSGEHIHLQVRDETTRRRDEVS